jgi:hypothetical protein
MIFIALSSRGRGLCVRGSGRVVEHERCHTSRGGARAPELRDTPKEFDRAACRGDRQDRLRPAGVAMSLGMATARSFKPVVVSCRFVSFVALSSVDSSLYSRASP